VTQAAARALDVEALRMERDRMARATVHSVRTNDGYARKFADASENAERLLSGVVAEKACDRTHGFRDRVQS
jgi:hypothetical protein